MRLNCRGRIIEFDRPIIMGILNVTPDSFYDGGYFLDPDKLMIQVEQMIKEGASIIDIGAMSSRPGSNLISTEEEIARLEPAILSIKASYPQILLSVDTFRSKVLYVAHKAGADIVNDISGGQWDTNFLKTVAKLKMPYILMHVNGDFETMHDSQSYSDVVHEMTNYFATKLRVLSAHGIEDVILDPGFGFSKSLNDNFEILRKIEVFNIFDRPLLVGLSRKSMICKTLKINPSKALNGTTALNMLALSKGASILRVHDVSEAIECIQLFEKMNS